MKSKMGLPWADYLNAQSGQRRGGPLRSLGLYCSDCHGTHPYNGVNRLALTYRIQNGIFSMAWSCPYTGRDLKKASNAI